MINNSLTDFEELTCTISHNALNALDFAKHIDARIECTWRALLSTHGALSQLLAAAQINRRR